MTIRAIVFDFDGVIANSEPLHFRGFHEVLADKGVHLSERDYYERYLGFDDAGLFRAIAADRGLRWSDTEIAELVGRKAGRIEAFEQDVSVLFPGAKVAIQRLAACCPLAIASGALGIEIRRVLDREDLARYFAAIVSAEGTPIGKPAPDPYVRAVGLLAAATRISLASHECVAVEDSKWGLQSAGAAGLRTVAITHTYPADSLADADLVIGHLDALTWDLLTTSLN